MKTRTVPETKPTDGILTRIEAARLLHRPPATLAYWATRREGPPFFKLGRRVVYETADILTWIRSQPRGGSPIPTLE